VEGTCYVDVGILNCNIRYSLIAGFMEPGETVEQAAVREVFEETGVECITEKVSYVTSQPWPFPSQLMIGFL
jgi:NAD+ diphosphatase